MKAADGVQIAERYKAQYAVTMAQKNTWPREYVKQLIEELSRAEERERVLREAMEKIRLYAIHGCGTKQKDVRGKQFGAIVDIADAALTAAPDQPSATKEDRSE